MENVRRDNCMMIRNLMNKVLDHILIDRDEEKAKNAVIQTVSDLLQNKLDISMLVISKSISKSIGEDDEGNEQENEESPTFNN